jgi:outer membrane receptor for ferrienterochelin and colicins
MKRLPVFWVFCLGLCLTGLATVQAGEIGILKYGEMNLEQLMNLPVYTASKHEQLMKEAPSSVTVITYRDIQAYGWRTFGDLLRSVPGFYVSYPGSYGFVGVRGFGRPGDFGGRILLLVNGHRMNDPLYDSAAIMEDFIVDMDLIDHVEIARGPGSALYGNNAFFAVVNVITKRADQINGTEISGEAGSHDTYRGRVTAGTRTSAGTEVLTSASGLTSDGRGLVRFTEPDSDEMGGLTQGDGETTGRFYGSVRRGGLTIEGFYADRNKDAPPGYGTTFLLPREICDGRGFLEGRYEKAFGETLVATARLYYDWYKYRGNYPYDMAALGQPLDLLVNRDESLAESVGGEVQANWHLNDKHLVTIGTDYRFDFRQMMKNFDVSPHADYLDIDPETRIFGFYLQDEYRLFSNLSLMAGLRYDHYETFGSTVNPRIACIYNPIESTTVKLLYGKAFRAPNANEFYYEDDGLTSKINSGLKPEKITTYEVVCEQKLNKNWLGAVAAFYNKVTDLIDQVQDPVDGLYYSANLNEVKAIGLEFQLDGQIAEKIRARASYTFTETEDDTTGKTLNNSPRHLGKLNLITPIYEDNLSLGTEVQYRSETTTAAGKNVDDLWLFNATLLSGRFKGVWDFSFSVYNLFDKNYHEISAGTTDTVRADGRNYRVKATVRF